MLYCRETVASSQKAALESLAEQMKEIEDTNSTLKADLQAARSSRSNEPKMKEKIAELEGCIDTLKQENSQLQVPREAGIFLHNTWICFRGRWGGGACYFWRIYQLSNFMKFAVIETRTFNFVLKYNFS